MSKATIADVAARAGVTKSTVSHALSGKRPVAAETRARIDAAIAELSYRPNPVAQRLAAGRSRAIGLVFPPGQAVIDPLDTVFIASAATEAAAVGYTLVLIQPAGDDFTSLPEQLGDGLLDGVIALRPEARDPRVDALRDGELPFVLIGRTSDNAGLSFVDIDVEAAVDLCVAHLHSLGHRRVAFLREAGARVGSSGRELQAYELACARRGIRLLTVAAGPSHQEVSAATRRLLGEHADLTGLVVWNEWAGWAACAEAEAVGLSVPAGLSIVCLGCGLAREWLPFAPSLVDLQAGQLASRAVRLLLEQLDGGADAEQQVLLQPELTAGATSGPPQAESRGNG